MKNHKATMNNKKKNNVFSWNSCFSEEKKAPGRAAPHRSPNWDAPNPFPIKIHPKIQSSGFGGRRQRQPANNLPRNTPEQQKLLRDKGESGCTMSRNGNPGIPSPPMRSPDPQKVTKLFAKNANFINKLQTQVPN